MRLRSEAIIEIWIEIDPIWPEGRAVVARVFADTLADVPPGPDYVGATPYAGAVGDFLSGGAGNDTLVGSNLSDALLGAEGDDLRLAA